MITYGVFHPGNTSKQFLQQGLSFEMTRGAMKSSHRTFQESGNGAICVLYMKTTEQGIYPRGVINHSHQLVLRGAVGEHCSHSP